MASFFKGSSRPAEEPRGAAAQPVPTAPAASVRPEPQREPAGERRAVIGPQIRIQGELSGDEDLVVEGKVEGKISVSKNLRIGSNAQVSAEIRASTVVIAGRVVGNVNAERVEIIASGYLEGNIRAPKIAIAEGAQFKGSVDMGGKGAGSGTPAAEKPGTSGETKAKA